MESHFPPASPPENHDPGDPAFPEPPHGEPDADPSCVAPPPPPTTKLLESNPSVRAVPHGSFPEQAGAYGSGDFQHMRTEFVFKVYDLLEKRLQFEAGWIGHRVAWLTASQSFLFAAYTTAALSPSPWSIPIRLIIIGTALGTLLPTASSIRAAMKVNESLVGVRGLLDRELKRIGDGIGNGNALSQWVELGLDEPSLAGVFRSSTPPRRKTYCKGGRAAKWVPRVLGASWCLLLLTFCPLVAEIVTERQAVQAPLPAPAPPAPDEAARLRAYWGGIHERLISPALRWIKTLPSGATS